MSHRTYDDFGEYLSADDAANAQAAALYGMLKAAGRVKDHRVIVYRCASDRRCLLLDVLRTPEQVVVHSPVYRLSPGQNAERSTEAGRAVNTRDGDRRWKGHTYVTGSAVNFSLNCDHVLGVVLDKTEVQADLDAERAEVLVRPDGTRYAV